MPNINVGQQDSQLTLSTPLPAAGANVTSGIIDLGTSGGNSNAWRMGRFAIITPNLPENSSGAGITVTMQAAGPLLTGGAANAAVAPIQPGVFAAPVTSQVTTFAAVAGAGSPAQQAYQLAAFDATGSTFQFYQWVITVPAGIVTQGEPLVIAWVKDSN
jgi:hypothetical protein